MFMFLSYKTIVCPSCFAPSTMFSGSNITWVAGSINVLQKASNSSFSLNSQNLYPPVISFSILIWLLSSISHTTRVLSYIPSSETNAILFLSLEKAACLTYLNPVFKEATSTMFLKSVMSHKWTSPSKQRPSRRLSLKLKEVIDPFAND